MRLAALIVSAAWIAWVAPAHATTVTEQADFSNGNAGNTDPNFVASTSDAAYAFGITGLTLTLAQTSATTSGGAFDRATFSITGDFMASADGTVSLGAGAPRRFTAQSGLGVLIGGTSASEVYFDQSPADFVLPVASNISTLASGTAPPAAHTPFGTFLVRRVGDTVSTFFEAGFGNPGTDLSVDPTTLGFALLASATDPSLAGAAVPYLFLRQPFGNSGPNHSVFDTFQVTSSTSAVPEPASLAIAGLGALALSVARRRRSV